MLNNLYIMGCALILGSTLLAGISQILLKISAGQEHKSRVHEYLNPWVVIAYGIFFITTVLSVLALRYIPLSLSMAVGAVGQVFVPLMSYFILGERISKRRILGIVIVMVGVVIFSF